MLVLFIQFKQRGQPVLRSLHMTLMETNLIATTSACFEPQLFSLVELFQKDYFCLSSWTLFVIVSRLLLYRVNKGRVKFHGIFHTFENIQILPSMWRSGHVEFQALTHVNSKPVIIYLGTIETLRIDMHMKSAAASDIVSLSQFTRTKVEQWNICNIKTANIRFDVEKQR